LSSRERAQAREQHCYEELLIRLQDALAALQDMAGAVSRLDVLCSFAERATSLDLCCPRMSQSPGIEIEGGRHPVIEQVQDEPFTPNDLSLGPDRRMLVITGPNMGGKSTYMRQAALIVLLAHIGCYVPADKASIGPVDRIFSRIGAADDLAGGRSTFMVEMTETANILHNATEHSLVLMDEIGRGTSTYDGLSLAWACAVDLATRVQAFTLFATHYFELTQLAQWLPEVANVHVAAAQSRGKVVFLHQVREGPASQSYGLAVAQLAGVPPEVVRRARFLLARLEQRAVANQPQLDLFAAAEGTAAEAEVSIEPAADELREKLAATDVDSLSPRDALALLYELQGLAGR